MGTLLYLLVFDLFIVLNKGADFVGMTTPLWNVLPHLLDLNG